MRDNNNVGAFISGCYFRTRRESKFAFQQGPCLLRIKQRSTFGFKPVSIKGLMTGRPYMRRLQQLCLEIESEAFIQSLDRWFALHTYPGLMVKWDTSNSPQCFILCCSASTTDYQLFRLDTIVDLVCVAVVETF
jgi:hypothetical protein